MGSLRRGSLALALIALAGLALLASTAAAEELEGFEAEEPPPAVAGVEASAGGGSKPQASARPPLRFESKASWAPEIAGAVFLLAFAVNFFRGRAANERLARAWAHAFCREGGVVDRNFALLGAAEGAELLMRDTPSSFKMWSSGRRYCTGMLATLRLKRRQDLLWGLWGLLAPEEDRVELEVSMQEASMPPMVLLIATPKLGKELSKELQDVSRYAHAVSVGRDRLPSWPAERLSVYAEQGSVFFDLMCEPVLELALGRAAFEPLARLFRYAHVSSEHVDEPAGSERAPASPPRKVLRFCFALPGEERMEELGRLMALVPLLVDAVGQYKLGPEQAKRAAKARSDAERAALKERQEARAEELARKKEEARKAEMERLKKLTPEARRRALEKKERQDIKKASRIRMVRS